MADAAVQAAHEEHRGRDAGAGENSGSVARLSLEDALAADDADDALGQAERRTGALEHRALLDVDLEEALRQRPPFDELAAADAAAFLVTEDDGGTATDAPDRLDRRDDAEGAVELAPVRHRVEVRARPDAGVGGAADQVPRGADLGVEPGLAHPVGPDLVRPVLARAPPDAVRSTPAADGV